MREERRHRKFISRFVYWANRHVAWYDLAKRAGYEVEWRPAAEGATHIEVWLLWESRVVAVLHRLEDGEWGAFAFLPEARAPRWKETLWRVRHPRRPRWARTITAP